MGDLILDGIIKIIVYLFRTVVRLTRERRSRKWPVTNGGVLEASLADLGGCPRAEVIYMYRVEGKPYTGLHKRGFWYRSSAEEYARHFPPKSDLVVRYNPRKPMASVVHAGWRRA